MKRINRNIIIFILVLALITIVGLFIKTQVDTEPLVKEFQVSGLVIVFEEGITEPEVKTILEDCNLPTYRLDYDVEDIADKYYIKVENNKSIVVSDEFRSGYDLKKNDYYIIPLSEQAIENESFLETLDKNNLRIKKFVWCHLDFGNEPENWISESDAIRIKNELEMNDMVLKVLLNYIKGKET